MPGSDSSLVLVTTKSERLEAEQVCGPPRANPPDPENVKRGSVGFEETTHERQHGSACTRVGTQRVSC